MCIPQINFDHAGGVDDFPYARLHALPQDRDEAAAHRCLDRQQQVESIANIQPILSRVDIEVAT